MILRSVADRRISNVRPRKTPQRPQKTAISPRSDPVGTDQTKSERTAFLERPLAAFLAGIWVCFRFIHRANGVAYAEHYTANTDDPDGNPQ